jgi:hypothetical protein
MKIRAIGVLSLVGLAMSASPVLAGPVGVQRSLSPDQETAVVAQLEAQRHEVARAIQGPVPQNKGPALISDMDRYSKLSDLMYRLQSGGCVAGRDRPGDAAYAPLIIGARVNEAIRQFERRHSSGG